MADEAAGSLTRAARHAFEDHTSELQMRLSAPNPPALFVEAALGLAEWMAGARLRAGDSPTEPIALQSVDREALLVDWLNELLFRTEVSGRLVTAVALDQLSTRSLRGRTGSVATPAPTHWVKAATLHGLKLREDPEGCEATVILDV